METLHRKTDYTERAPRMSVANGQFAVLHAQFVQLGDL